MVNIDAKLSKSQAEPSWAKLSQAEMLGKGMGEV